MNKNSRTTLLFLFLLTTVATLAADIRGRVVDLQSREPLTGATLLTAQGQGSTSDIDGRFCISGLNEGTAYTLTVKYVGYRTQTLTATAGADSLLIELSPDDQTLGEVRVTATVRRNTEASMLQVTRKSQVVMSNISAQEIRRTQDSNAGEVIRRVPGISLIDGKFVMVRGLAQRYNNVWMNGGAVPSSEADSRAFSFDIVPSSQIDNLMVVKSPAPEYPADFSGGFIMLNTKDIPSENAFTLSLGGGWNDATHFQTFRHGRSSATDWLGFDSGMRSFSGGFNAKLGALSAENSVSLTGNGLNNDWRIRQSTPLADLSLGASLTHHWLLGSGHKLGLIGTLNYSNTHRTQADMENNLFGIYDVAHDQSNYLRRFTDNQYNHNVRLGALLNLTLLTADGNHKLELKQIVNQLSNDRFTDRSGLNAQSDYVEFSEYQYRSRTTYNLQLTGTHTLGADRLAWGASYSYANRRMPDRRRFRTMLTDGEMRLESSNDIYREFTRLDEHIASIRLSDEHPFRLGRLEPTLQAGVYGEYRTRTYKTRDFIYNWEPSRTELLPADFRTMDMTTLLSTEQYFGEGGLYLLEQPKMTNDYDGNNLLGAGYVALTLPIGRLSLHGGLRYEYTRMELVRNLRDTEPSPSSTFYHYSDFFPSLNATYQLGAKTQLRLSYGRSVNRPEFREVSPSVFYDFDLAANVQGQYDLRPCYVDNVDLRYELYPSSGEMISVAAFFKHFDSPIEWTYTVAGGTDYVYSYENARSATSLGVEIDVRKHLDFIGLRNLSLSLNGALIRSRVRFDEGSRHHNRAMQGQSPYIVNAGLFYQHPKLALSAAVLYNVIGKRIIGVGRSEGSEDNARVPDSYEMPRHAVDITFAKSFLDGRLELKASLRNVLDQAVQYKSWADATLTDGTERHAEQVVRRYHPGRDLKLSVAYRF